MFKDESLFRLIFETHIYIQIHICYFKSLPIATSYETTIHIKNLYLHTIAFNMGLKEIHIWLHFPHVAR